jgi:exportin-1
VETFTRGLFDLNTNLDLFKAHLKDFLITLRQYSSAADQQAFADEAELEVERKRQAELEASLAVPGIVKPSDLDDDDNGPASIGNNWQFGGDDDLYDD